jgi:hypothetical protein
MATTIISVTFEVDAQRHKDGQFSVPKNVCDLLRLQDEDYIALVIKSADGVKFKTTKKLSSGKEIYGPEISEHVKAGDRITVTASRPS